MATIKLYANPKDAKKDGMVKIYLKLIHNRQTKFIPLDISVQGAQFNFEKFECTNKHNHYNQINSKIRKKYSDAELLLLDLADKQFTPDQLAGHIESKLKNMGSVLELRPFVESLIRDQKATGRRGNAQSYHNALEQIEKYSLKKLMFSDLTYTFLNDFKVYKLGQGLKPNSIAAYLRSVRVWCNEATNRELISADSYPFKRGLIPSRQRTAKKNLDESVLKQIIKLRPTLEGWQRTSVNTIVLQFLLQGIDFIDLIRLKKSDIEKGYITFTRYKNRSKGDQAIIKIKLLPLAKEIIKESESEFMVPVIDTDDIEGNFNLYNTRRRNLKRSLDAFCEDNTLPNLSFKAIRHSWATVAAGLGIREEIREIAMGHSSAGMQAIYTNISQKDIDQANEKGFSAILKVK